jgi:hypothetical protein
MHDWIDTGHGTRRPADDPLIASTASALRGARATIEAAVTARRAVLADRSRPVADQAMRIANLFETTSAKAAKQIDGAKARLEQEIASLDSSTARPKGMPNSSLSAEIRSRLLGMSAGDRTTAIEQAIKDDDLEIVAAILTGPGMLSGLDAGQVRHYRSMFRAKHFPEAEPRIARLTKTLAAVDQAGRALLSFHEAVANTPEQRLASESARVASEAVLAARAVAEGGDA